jgi:glycosyltransferase involved in cell wall biosynthesis
MIRIPIWSSLNPRMAWNVRLTGAIFTGRSAVNRCGFSSIASTMRRNSPASESIRGRLVDSIADHGGEAVVVTSQLLDFADVHLLPQRADVTDLVMPSKLAGMLASGRPIVASALEGSELHTVVSQCGFAVAPGDVAAFAAAIETLVDEPEFASRCGMKGRQYALANLDRQRVIENFLDSLALLRGA